jgi:hypothetical protein
MGFADSLDRPAGWHDGAAYERLVTLAERLSRTVAIARGLTAASRVVDLTGLEDGVGLLCAQALDLDPTASRRLVPALLELRAQIDGLSIMMAAHGAALGIGPGRRPPAERRGAH